jgi:hypothetical protein
VDLKIGYEKRLGHCTNYRNIDKKEYARPVKPKKEAHNSIYGT